MRTTFAVTAAFLSTLNQVTAQTYTSCNPLEKDCPADPALGTTLFTDFTKGASSNWEAATGTTITYDSTNGAAFTIAKAGNAPTMSMNKYIMFGRMEVVMKASPGQGTVSSLVLQSADLDEIDWEWLGADTSHVQSNFFGKGNTTTYNRGQTHAMSDPTAAFHTYTVDWTKQSIKWSIDGNLVRETAYSDPVALYGANYPQTPMEIKMGSWIGCASAEAATDSATKGTCAWAGGPIDLTKGPYVMYVKSVNVTDYGCAQSYVYGDRTGSYQSIKSVGGCASGSGDNNDESSSTTKASASSTSAAAGTSATTAPVLVETSASFATSTKTGATTATRQSANITQTQTPTAATTSAQVTGGASMTGASTLVLALGLAISYFLM